MKSVMPTVGRIVHYYDKTSGPLAAIVTRVPKYSDEDYIDQPVDLIVFEALGPSCAITGVIYCETAAERYTWEPPDWVDADGTWPYRVWCWPPKE